MRRKYYYKVMAVLTVVGLTVMSGCGDAKGKEEEAAAVLAEDEIYIRIDLHQGNASAKAWGCDLTYDYVKINADYRS